MKRRHKGRKSKVGLTRENPRAKEYWASRLHPHGEVLGKFTKKKTHKKERKENKKLCRIEND